MSAGNKSEISKYHVISANNNEVFTVYIIIISQVQKKRPKIVKYNLPKVIYLVRGRSGIYPSLIPKPSSQFPLYTLFYITYHEIIGCSIFAK